MRLTRLRALLAAVFAVVAFAMLYYLIAEL